MSTLPDSVYDDAVRAYLHCSASNPTPIRHLRATIDDPAAFRAALTIAHEAGREDGDADVRACATELAIVAETRRALLALADKVELSGPADIAQKIRLLLVRPIYTPLSPWADDEMHALDDDPTAVGTGADVPAASEFAETIAYHEGQMRALGITTPLAEARASVALDGETVTLDEPRVTP